jgi:hypothetical protein
MSTDGAREFRTLVAELVHEANLWVALRASADWPALRRHEKRLRPAIEPLRTALALIRNQPRSAPSAELTVGPAEANGHAPAVPAAGGADR